MIDLSYDMGQIQKVAEGQAAVTGVTAEATCSVPTPFVTNLFPYTDNSLSSALLSSGKALSSGQNPASELFLFSKSSQ